MTPAPHRRDGRVAQRAAYRHRANPSRKMRRYRISNTNQTSCGILKQRIRAPAFGVGLSEWLGGKQSVFSTGFVGNLEIIGPTYVFSAGSRLKIGRFIESAGTNPLVNSGNDRSHKFT